MNLLMRLETHIQEQWQIQQKHPNLTLKKKSKDSKDSSNVRLLGNERSRVRDYDKKESEIYLNISKDGLK